MLPQGPRAVRQLPGLHGAGQRPAAGGLHHTRSRRAWSSRTTRPSCRRSAQGPHRHAVRRGQPLLHVLREERQLRAAGAWPTGFGITAPQVPLPVPRSARSTPRHPDVLHRPQPLHPVRPLRPRLAGRWTARTSSSSSSAGTHKRVAVNAADGLGEHRPRR
ncbi:MAG: hypothetical protein MZU79_02295 [Anaerotruncus sp.]|nr:hypothetical protein [Anaerotruncus sp.]